MAADYETQLTEVEAKENKALDDTKKAIQAQKDAIQDYADEQSRIQQEQSDLAVSQLEQQKAQAEKDYIKEQSGAYVDWQKQSNQYGANAEQMASAGLKNSGYSESSQVSMYNTYQNRVATAREAFQIAKFNYDNAIKDAKLQNSSLLAEIATNALQQQLALSVELISKTLEIENIYHNQKTDIWGQMNTEANLAILKDQQELEEEKFAWEQEQAKKAEEAAAAAAKAQAARSRQYASTVGKSTKAKAAVDNVIKKGSTTKSTSDASAYSYLNALIASGASKDKVSNAIAIALRDGAITKEEATKLRNTFTPRGVQY